MLSTFRFVSTRGGAPAVSFSEAVLNGLAPDGGLYVPERWPNVPERWPTSTDAGGRGWEGLDPPSFASRFLRPFLAGDLLAPRLEALCDEAFNFPLPLVELQPGTALLELFHGPTAAFKDVGARFLAAGFSGLANLGALDEPLRILVATSGDTGAAVAAACHRRPHLEVGVLFPQGGVSPRQRQQLTCWDGNVESFEVHGSFDDCQRLTKELFRADDWPVGVRLTSANSINVGRLLPQAVYAARAAVEYQSTHGATPAFVVPSGNLGNVVGVYWAKKLGFPIGDIVIATNANTVVPDWFAEGVWKPRASIPTLANAMDVGDPSNMERLLHLFGGEPHLREASRAESVSDESIRATISAGGERWGHVFCPHTATAVHVRAKSRAQHCVIYATAHPAKFVEVVEPLVGHSVEAPDALKALLDRPSRVREVEPNATAFKDMWSRTDL